MGLQDLSIIVVSHNAKEVLAECLRRLETHYPEAEVIVVDSASSDGSREWVRDYWPKVKLIEVPNKGYPYAVNRGLEAARGRWLVEMNSDVYLEAGDLEALKPALESNPKAAFAGPTLITPKGSFQSFGFLYQPNYWNLKQPRAVGWISGAIIMARRETYANIGGMDEGLFFYNEEIEWCWRARRKGYQVLLVPRKVLHLGGASTPSDPRFIAEGYRGGLRLSRDYYPFWHGLHQKAVWLESKVRLALDPNPKHQEAYGLILQMLGRGDLETPFLP